ncbi:hypothetical protein RDWZM_004163 [Blomia tropicalis]|uniref:Uncharacterized protein n=1 Tax=Blomia tropicalis TaxID=40697 RepID=A0A9Q0MGK1_BLOTA|nr:hypothetical protein RDWZM_004163 [Blomia tropicalis]
MKFEHLISIIFCVLLAHSSISTIPESSVLPEITNYNVDPLPTETHLNKAAEDLETKLETKSNFANLNEDKKTGINLKGYKYLIGFGVGFAAFAIPLIVVMNSLSYQYIPTITAGGMYQTTGSSYNFMLTSFLIVVAIILFIILIIMYKQDRNETITMADMELAKDEKLNSIIGGTGNISATTTPVTSATSVGIGTSTPSAMGSKNG